MNTDYFDASVLCCACGGGSIPGSNTSDDSTSTDDTSTSDNYDSTSTDGTTIETGHWLWYYSNRADGSYELDYSTNTGTLYLSDGSMTAQLTIDSSDSSIGTWSSESDGSSGTW